MLVLDKPFNTPAAVQKGHVHAKNATAAFLFNDGDACNYIDGEEASVSGATWTEDGLFAVNTNDELVIDNIGNKILNSDSGSICMYITSKVAMTDNVYHYLMSANDGLTGWFVIYKSNNNLLYFLISNGTTNRSISYPATEFPNWTTGTCLCFVWNKNQRIATINQNYDGVFNYGLFVDGVYAVPAAAVNANALDTFTVSQTINVLSVETGNNPANAVLHYLVLCDTDMDEATAAGFAENPYAMFLPSFQIMLNGMVLSDDPGGTNFFSRVSVMGDDITERASHKTIVYNNRLFVLMGYNGTSYLGDIYSTNDGRTFVRKSSVQDTNGSVVSPRDSFGLCEFDKNVYLLGGWNGNIYYNDVYVTKDMVRWKKHQNASWSARSGFEVVILGNKMYVIGGYDGTTYLNEVWHTTDGVAWHRENNALWAGRTNHCCVATKKAVYVIGGQNGTAYYNDVWKTTDFRTWTRVKENAGFAGRAGHAGVLFRDKIVISGGQTISGYSGESWYSSDGKNWLQCPNIFMGSLRHHTMNSYNNSLIVVGGINGADTYRNEVFEEKSDIFQSVR